MFLWSLSKKNFISLCCLRCRICHLLLTLPTLRSLDSSVTEGLFFAGLIGNVQIDSIIPYILRMETSDFTGGLVSDTFQPKSDLTNDADPSPRSPHNPAVVGDGGIAHDYHSTDSDVMIGSYPVEQPVHERLLENSSLETSWSPAMARAERFDQDRCAVVRRSCSVQVRWWSWKQIVRTANRHALNVGSFFFFFESTALHTGKLTLALRGWMWNRSASDHMFLCVRHFTS